MSSDLALHNLNAHIDTMETVEAQLAVAREKAASMQFIAALQDRLCALGNQMNQLWDAWNDAMQAERLARIYK